MKLSEYKNEDALDLLADIIEPVSSILGDTEIAKATRDGEKKAKLIKLALKNHPSEIVEVLARMDGVPVEEYDANIAKMVGKLMEILNDKELLDFFTSQRLTEVEISSSDVTENTEEKEI